MSEFNLSTMQKEYWNNANHRWNVKTGATGSGKTFLDFYLIPKRIAVVLETKQAAGQKRK